MICRKRQLVRIAGPGINYLAVKCRGSIVRGVCAKCGGGYGSREKKATTELWAVGQQIPLALRSL